MAKTKSKKMVAYIAFTIKAKVEIPARDPYRLSDVQDVIESFQGIGEAEITKVELIEKKEE